MVVIFCVCCNSREVGKEVPRELREANPGLPEQEGQGGRPPGCVVAVNRETQGSGRAAGMGLGQGGGVCRRPPPPILRTSFPDSLSQMPSWPGHPHKCLQTHKLGSWRLFPSRGTIRMPHHPSIQECPCRHNPQLSLPGQFSLFPDTACGPALASLHRTPQTPAGGELCGMPSPSRLRSPILEPSLDLGKSQH